MLRTKNDYQFDDLSKTTDTTSVQYRIAPRDVINLRLYSNDGFKLIDLTSISPEMGQNSLFRSGIEYAIEQDGTAKLPILGKVKLSGMYIEEAERHLESLYSAFYNSPFILLDVTNRKVIVFPGGRGDAKVVTIGENTTLLEGIAQAGGIAETGKAKKIKLIRKEADGTSKIYKIDLSRIEGLPYANIVLQRDDIVYVEPRTNVSREVFRDVLTYMSAITSIFTVYFISQRF